MFGQLFSGDKVGGTFIHMRVFMFGLGGHGRDGSISKLCHTKANKTVRGSFCFRFKEADDYLCAVCVAEFPGNISIDKDRNVTVLQ